MPKDSCVTPESILRSTANPFVWRQRVEGGGPSAYWRINQLAYRPLRHEPIQWFCICVFFMRLCRKAGLRYRVGAHRDLIPRAVNAVSGAFHARRQGLGARAFALFFNSTLTALAGVGCLRASTGPSDSVDFG